MKNKSKKGFTLVEIMIVVVIIGLLAAMAIPAFSKMRLDSVRSTLDNDARQLAAAANELFLRRNVNSVTLAQLVGPGLYIESLSNGVTVTGPFSAALDSTFTMSHANLPASPITYRVDTGRDNAIGNNLGVAPPVTPPTGPAN
jgi:type IV pilus assembly protein PilA